MAFSRAATNPGAGHGHIGCHLRFCSAPGRTRTCDPLLAVELLAAEGSYSRLFRLQASQHLGTAG